MAKAWAERLPSGNYSGRFRHPLTGRKERAGTHPDKDLALAAARRALREVTRLYDGDPDVCPVSGGPDAGRVRGRGDQRSAARTSVDA